METKPKIAVLIDGDNAESTLIEYMFSEISKYGKITIKRVYGDWTIPSMNSWKDKINENAIRPIQKFSYTKGKNSTDTAMIIDAMEILHNKQVDGFCLVSSDSDYTGIAHKIREEGLFIMGIGRKETPIALVKACETFIYTEILKPIVNAQEKTIKEIEDKTVNDVPKLKGVTVIGKIDVSKFQSKITKKAIDPDFIDRAYRMAANDQGWALACRIKEALKSLDSSFDSRIYGYTTFRKFLEALVPPYEIKIHEDHMTISVIKRENGTTNNKK